MAKMIMLSLPFNNHDGHRDMSVMRLAGEKISRRLAYRLMRRFYKQQIGIPVHKSILSLIWRRRLETALVTAAQINDNFTKMAHESYLEVTNTEDESSPINSSGE